jgi:hypothetical protein
VFKTARSVTDKECVRCNKKIFDVDATTKYCNECRELVNDEFYKNNYERRKSRRNELKNTEEKLIDNFLNIVKEDYQLTPAGFNEVSEISSFSYQNYYRISWLEILKKFGKSQQMIDYILKEYKIFVSTGYQDFKKFVKEHKYVSEALIKHVGRDKLREFANVRVRRNTDDDYKNNFLNIMKQLGHIPLFHEFLEISCIKPNSYANRFNLKGKVYDNIVKLYVSEDEYNKYLIQKRIHKSEVGTETGKLALKYTDEFLIEEYKRVFNFCLNEYGTLPTNDLFNELSITDDSMYRKRFEMSWADFGRKLGYKIEKTSNKSEKTALEVVKSIINEDYDHRRNSIG